MQCPQCGREASGDQCAACGAYLTEETPKWYAEGVAHLASEKQYTIATELLQEGLRRYPRSAMLWFNAGVLAEMMQNRREAASCYQRAVQLKPGSAKYRQALERLTGKPVLPPPQAAAPAPPPPTAMAAPAQAPVVKAPANASAFTELEAQFAELVRELHTTPDEPPRPDDEGQYPPELPADKPEAPAATMQVALPPAESVEVTATPDDTAFAPPAPVEPPASEAADVMRLDLPAEDAAPEVLRLTLPDDEADAPVALTLTPETESQPAAADEDVSTARLDLALEPLAFLDAMPAPEPAAPPADEVPPAGADALETVTPAEEPAPVPAEPVDAVAAVDITRVEISEPDDPAAPADDTMEWLQALDAGPATAEEPASATVHVEFAEPEDVPAEPESWAWLTTLETPPDEEAVTAAPETADAVEIVAPEAAPVVDVPAAQAPAEPDEETVAPRHVLEEPAPVFETETLSIPVSVDEAAPVEAPELVILPADTGEDADDAVPEAGETAWPVEAAEVLPPASEEVLSIEPVTDETLSAVGEQPVDAAAAGEMPSPDEVVDALPSVPEEDLPVETAAEIAAPEAETVSQPALVIAPEDESADEEDEEENIVFLEDLIAPPTPEGKSFRLFRPASSEPSRISWRLAGVVSGYLALLAFVAMLVFLFMGLGVLFGIALAALIVFAVLRYVGLALGMHDPTAKRRR